MGTIGIKVERVEFGIGSRVSVTIGRGRAVGTIAQRKYDDVLGAFYMVRVESASDSMGDMINAKRELWICPDEIRKVI